MGHIRCTSESIATGRERVDFVPFVGPRDLVNVARSLGAARRILHDDELDTVVSTGAAVAVPFVGIARTRQMRCHYIEGAARVDGPSLTGRMISRMPGVKLYAQHRTPWGRPWQYGGSVFDIFEQAAAAGLQPTKLNRVVVSVGTEHGYGFPRLIRRLREILPSETEVLWQTGDTDVSGFGVTGHEAIPEHEFTEAMREADVVISHAGVGTALAAFGVGKCPLLVPRRASFREHVDDHQQQIAGELADRGLSVSVDADDLCHDDILAAARNRVKMCTDAPPFVMAGT